jgi:hypothetical protein
MEKLKKALKILTLSAAALIVLYLIIPSRPVSRQDYEFDGVTARKQCISFMKTIQGSAELYYLEAKLSGEVKLDSPVPLVSGRYINANVKCPRSPETEYTTIIRSLKDTTEVECAVHGRLSETETTGLEKGLRKRTFFEKIFLDVVNQR